MKKTTICLSLLLVVALSYATVPGGSIESEKNGLFKIHSIMLNDRGKGTGTSSMARNFNCSVTITASVGYSSTYLLASCSSTKTTCNAAIAEASGCVKSALEAAKKNMK